MSEYEKRFNKIVGFMNMYHDLINCHMVDFITDRLWDKCLPSELKLELERNELNDKYWVESNDDAESKSFINSTRALSLESCPLVINAEDIGEILSDGNRNCTSKCKETKTELMSTKKVHEVEILGDTVASLATSSQSLVIDAGAGKAYLSTYLAEKYKISVLAVDSSRLCHKGAIYRQEKLQKKARESQSSVRYTIEEINSDTDYVKLVKDTFCDWNLDKNLILIGLHTCGSLAHSTIRAFLRTKDISALCIVPCCYHLTDEALGKNSFSKNARMLAQQSLERSVENKPASPSLFYRAVLQVILRSIGISDARIGRGGPLHDFPSYAKWALLRIGIEHEKIPSADDLENVYQSYARLKNRFYMFHMLRIHTSPVLEAAIMLDRIIFLQKSKKCSKLAILRLFDPVLSPRRYGIVAIK